MVETRGADMAEILDEIVQQDRYGKRNYRNSIGADNKRHWRGTYLVTENSVDVDVDEKQLADFMDKKFEEVTDEQLGEDSAQNEPKDLFVPDKPVVDRGATYNITEPVEPKSDNDDLTDADKAAKFFDPLSDVDQLDEVLKQQDDDTSLYGTESTDPTDDVTVSADADTTSDTDETDDIEETGEVDAS